MTTTKLIITTAAASLAFLLAPAHANTPTFYAGKIVKNCDYPPGLSKQLIGAFLEKELFILRIMISINEQVCGQTADFLAANKKPIRTASESYIRQQYLAHQEQIREAESLD